MKCFLTSIFNVTRSRPTSRFSINRCHRQYKGNQGESDTGTTHDYLWLTHATKVNAHGVQIQIGIEQTKKLRARAQIRPDKSRKIATDPAPEFKYFIFSVI